MDAYRNPFPSALGREIRIDAATAVNQGTHLLPPWLSSWVEGN